MKKTLLIAALFFTFHLSNAQGNLQFNKVIYETYIDSEFPSGYKIAEFSGFTVPDGKIWKVNLLGSINPSAVGEVFQSTINDNILPNVWFIKSGDDVPVIISSRMHYDYNKERQEYLLSAGTYNFRYNSVTNAYKVTVIVNGTEFNIITE